VPGPDDLRTRFGAARVARLATVADDGRPHVVAVCFALDGETIVTAVDAKPKTTTELRRLANVRANAAVSVLVDHYDDDWTRLWWVRADGDARVLAEDEVTRGDERAAYERAVELLTAKYAQYRDAPPRGAVIEIAVRTWRGWSWRGDG
jgi:PPOX class probable F420-dependent enzyme